jgi:hypothetical protein
MKKFISKIDKETLGSLISRFLNIYDKKRSDSIHEESYFDKPGLIFSKGYSIDWTLIKGSKKELEKKIGIWEKLVQERNKAVHHLAFEYDLNCLKSCEKLLKDLKKLNSDVQGCIKDLGEIMKMAGVLFKPLKTIENIKLEKVDRFHKLFSTINIILNNFKEKDGWTELSVVGQLVKERVLKEFKEYKSINGCRTLREVLLKSNLYDVKKDGKKIWFRLKA